ncbi:MAG: RNA polymerase sigma factor [Akkermansiaceae bacterium]
MDPKRSRFASHLRRIQAINGSPGCGSFSNKRSHQTGEPSRPAFQFHARLSPPGGGTIEAALKATTDNYQTRQTLIQRACDPGNERAWAEFDQTYRRFIAFVLGRLGVSQDDVDDLTQKIFTTLTQSLSSYDRNKATFRTWLSTVIRNTAFAHFKKQKREQKQLARIESESDLSQKDANDVDALIKAEWGVYIANLAMQRVRDQFQGKAIEVFELGLDGVPVEDIARRTELSTASVYTLRKRVKKRLYLEIRSLIQEQQMNRLPPPKPLRKKSPRPPRTSRSPSSSTRSSSGTSGSEMVSPSMKPSPFSRPISTNSA